MKTNTTNTKPAYEPNLSERLHGLRKAVEDTLATKEYEDSVASEMNYHYSKLAWREEEQHREELLAWKSFARVAYAAAIANHDAADHHLANLRTEFGDQVAILENEVDSDEIQF
jgi:hypothetical protein